MDKGRMSLNGTQGVGTSCKRGQGEQVDALVGTCVCLPFLMVDQKPVEGRDTRGKRGRAPKPPNPKIERKQTLPPQNPTRLPNTAISRYAATQHRCSEQGKKGGEATRPVVYPPVT